MLQTQQQGILSGFIHLHRISWAAEAALDVTIIGDGIRLHQVINFQQVQGYRMAELGVDTKPGFHPCSLKEELQHQRLVNEERRITISGVDNWRHSLN